MTGDAVVVEHQQAVHTDPLDDLGHHPGQILDADPRQISVRVLQHGGLVDTERP